MLGTWLIWSTEVFVDVSGDKYLARIVKTFPPRTMSSSITASPVQFTSAVPVAHPFATDLSLTAEELEETDDPMRYFYNVRLIEEGAMEGAENGLANGHAEDGEKWEGSVMEVQANKISRDRINFSRAMLKRFIRDCVVRDAAIYSPWMVKRSVALRFGLPTEMSEEVREGISRYRERQMDKRKKEREERMGLTIGGSEVDRSEDEKPKTKKKRKEDERRIREEERAAEEEVAIRKRPTKYPAEGE